MVAKVWSDYCSSLRKIRPKNMMEWLGVALCFVIWEPGFAVLFLLIAFFSNGRTRKIPKLMYLCPMGKRERMRYMCTLFLIRIMVTSVLGMLTLGLVFYIRKIPGEMVVVEMISYFILVLIDNLMIIPTGYNGRPEIKLIRKYRITGFTVFCIVAAIFSYLSLCAVIAWELIYRLIGFWAFALIMMIPQIIAVIGVLYYWNRVISLISKYEFSF